MPLPFILGAAAAAAAAAGVGSGIHGGIKMKEAKDSMEAAQWSHQQNIKRFEEQNRTTTNDMDQLGSLELAILNGFNEFSDVFEKIQNRPEFKPYQRDGVDLPKYDGEKLKEVSVAAGVVIGGLSGAALGTAGGFAAAGATTAAVMALGVASTGTPIAALSGIAATNATLAALGGGALAAGGGGIALGSAILGATTLGVGLLVGGAIFNATGSSLSDKADEAWSQMRRAEKTINTACEYLQKLSETATRYQAALVNTRECYIQHFNRLKDIVLVQQCTDWQEFSEPDRKTTENTVLLVSLLYNMCKVKLILESEKGKGMISSNSGAVTTEAGKEDSLRPINSEEIEESICAANKITGEIRNDSALTPRGTDYPSIKREADCPPVKTDVASKNRTTKKVAQGIVINNNGETTDRLYEYIREAIIASCNYVPDEKEIQEFIEENYPYLFEDYYKEDSDRKEDF